MNYLSHHHVARLAVGDDAPADLYLGNILPDLLAVEGSGGRLRPVHLAAAPAADLARGVGLHLAVDRRFHAAPEFARAMEEAATLLRSVPFSAPPGRMFFLAHVFVELALDAVLVREDAGVADHLYAAFEAADLPAVAEATGQMLGRPLPFLAQTLARFADARYLYGYADADGLAQALHRICRRARQPGFPDPSDRSRLGGLFTAFQPCAAAFGPMLWTLPEAVVQ